MWSSCEGDPFILFRLFGFSVNSFDLPPQLGAVGPVVYALMVVCVCHSDAVMREAGGHFL